ncbi:SDR family oxidoreductase [Pseudomethylobacillus aquaticus]|uniref:SDR family oxidoreductase n=1 Tax=Pseudomethylobacillus aquaticus TaxID=2676064 RepID=A0A3N0V698_9PROT|nr:SDR family oxidoreductase [Pseudomethylobacillus aquaticus]ROH88289.1 SDR family oxidoreductase [Pseudomethylobacillus aquaticus]
MRLNNQHILLTGATGGIGRELALLLAAQGARLALVCHDRSALQALQHEVDAAAAPVSGAQAVTIVADFRHVHAAQGVADAALQQLGHVDMLINNAGILDFTAYEQQSPARISDIMQVNVTTPMLLTRALLPQMLHQQRGHIVNIGSMYGSIGFPYYASYSASKFAMRGFSQALRRELADGPLDVSYVAPRAVRTRINDSRAAAMMQATGTTQDAPHWVAQRILQAVLARQEECYLGQPESLFAWLNGVLPKLVSQGLRKQARIARHYVYPAVINGDSA